MSSSNPRVIIIAAMDPNGVIGRTTKRCPNRERYRACVVGHCDVCGGVGRLPANDLPWPPGTYREDMEHFKATTMGSCVVVGRNTAEGAGKFWPFVGRSNVMVTSRVNPGELESTREGEYFAPDLAGALAWDEFYNPRGRTYVAGGARLFVEAIPLADELDLTLVKREWSGDVFFPRGEHFHRSDAVVFSPDDGRTLHRFECVERKPCPTNDELVFTTWRRHA